LKGTELGFWAPCIRLTDDSCHYLAGRARSNFGSKGGFLDEVNGDFGPYGGICFDDDAHSCLNEIVVLVGMDELTGCYLFETRFEVILGLAVRTENAISTRLGLVELFYSEPNLEDENAIKRHRNWLEFVASDKTDLYWRYVVLQ